jgi:hypothetical protein
MMTPDHPLSDPDGPPLTLGHVLAALRSMPAESRRPTAAQWRELHELLGYRDGRDFPTHDDGDLPLDAETSARPYPHGPDPAVLRPSPHRPVTQVKVPPKARAVMPVLPADRGTEPETRD